MKLCTVLQNTETKKTPTDQKKTSTILCCDEAKRSTKLMSFFYSNLCKPPKLKPALKNVSVSQHQPGRVQEALEYSKAHSGTLGGPVQGWELDSILLGPFQLS